MPRRIRQALNVEAGLNDGLAVPFLLLFVAGATVTEGLEPASFWATTLLQKVGIGGASAAYSPAPWLESWRAAREGPGGRAPRPSSRRWPER